VNFKGDHHNRLSSRTAATVPTVLLSSDKSLIDLDISAQPFPSGAHHGASPLVQPTPGGLVTAQAQYTLKP
jgi:hypothetical protein